MVRTKNTARGTALGLPRAKFANKRKPKMRIRLNQVPSDGEATPLHVADWQTLEPSLTGQVSPEVEAALDKANQACPLPTGPPPEGDQPSIAQMLRELPEVPPETRPPSPLSTSRTPPRSPFEDGMVEDEPAEAAVEGRPPPPLEPTVTVETVEERTVMGNSIAMAKGTRLDTPLRKAVKPNPPTIAKKCPRPEFQRDQPRATPQPNKKRKALSALQEIRHLQSTYKPVLPLAPFARLVKEVLQDFGQYRMTREAFFALRCCTEQYGLDTLQAANLLTMHRDRCTLMPKDIRMARRVRGEDEIVGITEEAAKATSQDWVKFKEQRVTLAQAVRMESSRRRKLRDMANRRFATQRRAIMN